MFPEFWLCPSTWQMVVTVSQHLPGEFCLCPSTCQVVGTKPRKVRFFPLGTQSSEGRALPFPNGCCAKWVQHCEITGGNVRGIHQEVTKAILEFQKIPFVHFCTGIWSKGWQPLLNAQTHRSCILCQQEGTTPTKGNQKITCYHVHTFTIIIGLLTLCNYQNVWK